MLSFLPKRTRNIHTDQCDITENYRQYEMYTFSKDQSSSFIPIVDILCLWGTILFTFHIFDIVKITVGFKCLPFEFSGIRYDIKFSVHLYGGAR